MSHSFSRRGAFAVFGCWAAVGAAAGAAIAYFAYARQPREFASSAVVRFERFEDEPTNKQSGEVQPRQQSRLDAALGSAATLRNPPDDSLLLCGQTVLSEAAVSGNLMEIQELRVVKAIPTQTSADDFVRNWVTSGRLMVTQFKSTSRGGLYRVTFRSELPSVSNRVVSAVVAAMVERFDGQASQNLATETIQDLRQRREELGRQAEDLQRTIENLDLPQQAVLQDGRVVSPAAIKLDASIRSFERLTLQREGLQQRLRRAEELLAQNADERRIMEMLGVLTKDGEVPGSAREASPEQAEKQKSERERRQWLAEKEKLTVAVDREVQPLQKQLDELLGIKYGPQHPQIRHLKTLIAKAKGKLAEYAVEPDFGVTVPPVTPDGASEGDPIPGQDERQLSDESGPDLGDQARDAVSAGDALPLVLTVLNGELKGLSNDLSRVDAELEALATIVAYETQVLQRKERLGLEIQQLQEIRKSLEGEVQHAVKLDEKVASSLEVLSASGPAVQVSPILNSYLRFGSLLGVVVGFLLFVILWFAISLVPSNTVDEKTAG